MKNHVRGLYVLLTVCTLFLLASCIDLRSDIEVNEDGSGTIQLTYTAVSALVHLGTIDEDDRFYAIPISEDDFRSTAGEIEGITLRSFAIEDEVDTVTVTATLDFDSPAALSRLFGSSGPGTVEITSEGASTLYRQLIYGGAAEEIDAESRDFIESFFADYSVEFSLEAPQQISAVNSGDFTGRVATIELPMTEVLLSPSPIEWEVRW